MNRSELQFFQLHRDQGQQHLSDQFNYYMLELNHADHEETESEPLRRGTEQQDVLRRLPRRGAAEVTKLRITTDTVSQ